MRSRVSTIRCATAHRGVVLPIVLVVLMVVTMLVITQVRRGTVDERLAGNWNRAMSGQAAAESLLRYCEAAVFAEEDRLRSWQTLAVKSENYTTIPAWNSPLTAADVIQIAADLLPPQATGAVCVIEDADEELNMVMNQQGNNEGLSGGREQHLHKLRFTMSVTFADGTAFGSVIYRAQSEVRYWL